MATKTFKIGLSNTDKQNMAQDVYERVLDLTFAEYDSSNTYNKGNFVVYSDALYKCKEDNVTGTWDSSKWESATLQDLLDDVEGAVASVSGKANTIDLLNGTLVPAKSLSAKQIENVSDEVGSTQTAPFIFQATGTANNTTATPTAPVAKHLELRGNSVAWNQLARIADLAETTTNYITYSRSNGEISVSGTASADTTFTAIGSAVSTPIITTHKFLVKWNLKGTKPDYNEARNNIFGRSADFSDAIFDGSNVLSTYLQITITSGSTVNFTIKPQIFDLTLMYGTGNEPEDVVSFNRDYPLPYYDFNVGTLKSGESKQLVTIGCNQFDGEIEGSGIDVNTGLNITATNNFRTKNYIKVVPGETYAHRIESSLGASYWIIEYDGNHNYIKNTLKSSAESTIQLSDTTYYVRINYYKSGSGWKDNPPSQDTAKIMFRLYWDEAHDYVAYEKHTYGLPTLDEPLRSAGSVCDILSADGTLTRNIGVVKLKDLTWTSRTINGHIVMQSIGLVGSVKNASSDSVVANIICALYEPDSWTHVRQQTSDKTISIASDGFLNVYDSAYTDETTFKNHFTDNDYLYYELATPTTTQDQSKAFAENIVVDDFGTMEFVPVDGATEPIIPQGNKFFYPADYVLFIDDMYNRSKDGGDDADASNFVVQSELTPYANQDTILQNAIGGTLRQCLSVKASIDFLNTDVVDLGTLSDWDVSNVSIKTNGGLANVIKKPSSNNEIANIICTKYRPSGAGDSALTTSNLRIGINANGVIRIYDTSLLGLTSTQVKAAMKGILVAYEKA